MGSQITNATEIAGHTWNLWKGPNANWEVLSFVSATGDLTDFNVDLNDFFSKIRLLRRPADPLMICFRISYCGTGSIGIPSKSLHLTLPGSHPSLNIARLFYSTFKRFRLERKPLQAALS